MQAVDMQAEEHMTDKSDVRLLAVEGRRMQVGEEKECMHERKESTGNGTQAWKESSSCHACMAFTAIITAGFHSNNYCRTAHLGVRRLGLHGHLVLLASAAVLVAIAADEAACRPRLIAEGPPCMRQAHCPSATAPLHSTEFGAVQILDP